MCECCREKLHVNNFLEFKGLKHIFLYLNESLVTLRQLLYKNL